MKLAMVQSFSRQAFLPEGWELLDKPVQEKRERAPQETDALANVIRASRRAKIGAFDLILCNHDIDTFATFTYAPERIDDKNSYDECYQALRPWLSNRVQRSGLKYVVVPERHKSGAIHFHMVANSAALSMEQALSPYTGKPLHHNGNLLYNIRDWKYGFTSAEIIRGGADDREAVAKYIFKYMGKQAGEKIGGRYFLHGGEMRLPHYEYSNDPREFFDGAAPTNAREVEPLPGVVYREWTFV